jgi:hypothetical protein
MPITGESIFMEFHRKVYLTTIDEPDMKDANSDLMFWPSLITVEFKRTAEHEPWTMTMVVAEGSRRKKDGTVGQTKGERAWVSTNDRSMPEWVRKAVLLAVQRAEQNRTMNLVS